MSRGNRHVFFLLSLIVSVGLSSQASLHASAVAASLDHRLRTDFPAIREIVGIGDPDAGTDARGVRSAAEPEPVRGFIAERFGDGYRIENGRSLVVLRPELSRRSTRSLTPSGAIYTDAFPGVDAFRSESAGAQSEVFVIGSAREAGAVAYRVISADGILEIVNNGRGVRFVSASGPDSFVSAPLAVDSAGRLAQGTGWEVDRSERGVVATLRLRVRDRNLKYPIAIAYSPGRATIASRPLKVAPAGTASVSGTVTQSGGGAIAGAVVYLYDSASEFVSAATTDGAGAYSIGGLETDTYRALAIADAHTPQLYNNIDCPNFDCSPLDGSPIAVTDGNSTSGISFALKSNAASVTTLTGAVTGPSAAPLEGITVVVYNGLGVALASSSSDGAGSYQVTLDQGGTFYARTFNGRFAGLVDSLYSGIKCSACNPTSGTAITLASGATASNIDFALVNGGRISGQITDAFDASPLAERQVAIYNASGAIVTFATSDDSGNYTSFHGLVTGNYYALATAGGFFSQLYSGTDCTNCSITSGSPISVTLGATTSNINFALHSSQAIVKGNVVDAVTGAALGGVLVVFYNASGQQVLATTSDFAEGRYTIYLPAAGQYFALTQNGLQQDYLNQLYSGIDCSGCSPMAGTAINVVFGVPFENVDFALKKTGGTISGTILDATTGSPAPSAFVQVFSPAGILAAYGFADTAGQYSASDGLTTGDYYVIARAPGYVPTLYTNIPCSTGCTVTAGTAVHVTSGQTTANINFNLGTTTAFITGHVFAAGTGTPLADVDVGVFDANGNQIGFGSSDAAGQYAVQLARGGTYFARTINSLDSPYHDQIWDHRPCEDCSATTGTPISVTDGSTTANINFDLLTVACSAITLSPGSLPNTTVGVSYNVPLSANGATNPTTFALTSGALPAGIVLSSSGALSGSATVSGTSSFTITATDANGCTGRASYTISVSAGPTTTSLSASTTNAVFGTMITFTATVSPALATGTITFSDGATSLGAVPLAGGTASIQVASLTAGTHNVTAAYGGSSAYAPSGSAVVAVTITKATPLITWPPPAPITYPAPLTAVQLNATANVPGSFVYNPAAGTILNAGSQILAATFTPADTLNYDTASASVTLLVNKGAQQIQWPNPAAIVYGTLLGPTQLNATVSVTGPSPAGALTYNPPAGTLLTAGTHPLTVTAAATSNYNEANATVTITVNKATPVFSNLVVTPVVIGTATATVTGKISLGTLIPTGFITVDAGGNVQSVPIQAGGTFSATFPVSGFPAGVFPILLTYGGDANFNPATASPALTVMYAVRGGALGEQPFARGSAIPFRIEIVDAFGNNLSSAAITVTAYGVQKSGTTSWLPATPTGNNSQQFQFQKGNKSYLFNLKTTDLVPGDYVFGFVVGSDPTIHTLPFSIRQPMKDTGGTTTAR